MAKVTKIPGCPITVFPQGYNTYTGRSGHGRRCDQRIQPGAKFCAKHEADRIRLGGR